jgi:hypothetical protein
MYERIKHIYYVIEGIPVSIRQSSHIVIWLLVHVYDHGLDLTAPVSFPLSVTSL